MKLFKINYKFELRLHYRLIFCSIAAILALRLSKEVFSVLLFSMRVLLISMRVFLRILLFSTIVFLRLMTSYPKAATPF